MKNRINVNSRFGSLMRLARSLSRSGAIEARREVVSPGYCRIGDPFFNVVITLFAFKRAAIFTLRRRSYDAIPNPARSTRRTSPWSDFRRRQFPTRIAPLNGGSVSHGSSGLARQEEWNCRACV